MPRPDVRFVLCRPRGGRIGTYATRYDAERQRFVVDGPTAFPVEFDRDRACDAPLLVHEWHGGGFDSVDALRRLRFTAPVADIIRVRIAPLGSDYVGVHLRHTDEQVDAEGFLESLRESLTGRRVLVCTDDPRLLADARRILAGSTVLVASEIMDTGGLPQHHAAPVAPPVVVDSERSTP